MPNWQRTPPVSGLSVEEMKQRVADGIKRRRQTGELRPQEHVEIKTIAQEPVLTKQHKRVLFRAAELAIYSLANAQALDYCHACDAINAVRRQAGLPTRFMQEILKGVAHTAADLAHEPFEVLDQLARRWLTERFTPSGKLISLPTVKGH